MGPKKKPITSEEIDEALEDCKKSIIETFQNELKTSIDALRNTIINNLVKENKRLSKKVVYLEETIEDINDMLYFLTNSNNDQGVKTSKLRTSQMKLMTMVLRTW